MFTLGHKTRKTKTIGAYGDLSRLYQLVKRVKFYSYAIPIIFQRGYESKPWDLRYLRRADEWIFYSPSHVDNFIGFHQSPYILPGLLGITIWLFNIAMEYPVNKWRFLAGKIIKSSISMGHL